MRVRIDADNERITERVRQLLHFVLSPAPPQIVDTRISVHPFSDAGSTELTRCQAEIHLRNGEKVTVEEIQFSLELAVSRALERSLRTIQRRATVER